MNSAGASSSPFDSFKSKKVLRSSVSKQHSTDEAIRTTDQDPWSSKTPEKPKQQPRRSLTRRQPLRSVRQVREAVKQLRTSDPKPSVSSDPLASMDTPSETPITKPKTLKPLPERYEILDKFFTSLQSSIQLLTLRGSTSTFTNISRAVENMTDRRFTYTHLAQLKFILPEGIELKKILRRDELTSCMKPDLDVTLNYSFIENDEKLKSESKNIQMWKLFRSRLVSFHKSNPEGDDVPAEILPEPFNQSSSVNSLIAMKKPALGLVQDRVSQHQPMAASHMSQSFKRRFSNRVSDDNSTKVVCEPLPETPIKSFLKKGDLSSMDGTPAKLISTPISATPAQAARGPVRGFMTPDGDSVTSPTKSAPTKLTRRSALKRLPFDTTPLKNKTPPVKKASSSSSDEDDYSDILSGDLFASITEKERKAMEENDPAISQAKWRKQMIAGLPKLFDSLLFIFLKRSVFTKEELIHTIISCRLEIVDRREVEEQLILLQELAPEWIYQKKASSGDLLFCVNKISSPESIRSRLSEAN